MRSIIVAIAAMALSFIGPHGASAGPFGKTMELGTRTSEGIVTVGGRGGRGGGGGGGGGGRSFGGGGGRSFGGGGGRSYSGGGGTRFRMRAGAGGGARYANRSRAAGRYSAAPRSGNRSRGTRYSTTRRNTPQAGRASQARRSSVASRRVQTRSVTRREATVARTRRASVNRQVSRNRGSAALARDTARNSASRRDTARNRADVRRDFRRDRARPRYDGRDRHFRRGQWYAGYPRWRSARRWHNGYYWRNAYDGWYYWDNDAWFWAPTFGIVVAAGAAYYGYDYADTTVVVTYEPWSDGWYSWCGSRYRSFDPGTGYWTGYDGIQRFCVYR